MRKSIKKTTINVLLCAVCALILFSGCASSAQSQSDPPSTNGRLNVVDALGLEDSVRIEILEFDTEDRDPTADYLPAANITNLSEVEQVIFLLDAELQETPAVLCIPEYRLRFWLEDDTQIELDFSCEGASFITGDQPAFSGRQFSPPAKFTGLIRSYLVETSAEIPQIINLLKAAEFTDVVRIEILEQNLGEGSAEVTSLLVIEDIEVIEEVMLALSGDLELHPQVRCPVEYFITFTLDDDRVVTWGYMCGGEDTGILRGDQDYFFGQDIHLGENFVALFEGLINPEVGE